MISTEKLITAIRQEHLGGWLFYNLNHHDPLADKILGIPFHASNTRPWIYILRADSTAVKIVHQIEPEILAHLAGETVLYSGRQAMEKILAPLSGHKKPFALNFSVEFPKLSFIDHGTFLWLASLGWNLVSSQQLILLSMSTLSADEIASHEAAGMSLYAIVHNVWKRIADAFTSGDSGLYEGTVLGWVMEEFSRHNLETELPLIIGTGKNTTKPHYSPDGKGDRLKPGQVLQIDIWGKKKEAGAIYADISWVGFLGRDIPAKEQEVFRVIRDARDAVIRLAADRFAAGLPVSGAELDAKADEFIRIAGFGEYIKHRTGHSIDTDVHGTGINIDSREFPDTRQLAEGCCFSVEPGLYLEEFGMRTEIDVYIKNSVPVISGAKPQQTLLCF
ncbi:MAG: aminopeptidase P family protein [Spirochaetales bacterium]|nr:aminopeptidase P family protein [Spirochaetales bacterium]